MVEVKAIYQIYRENGPVIIDSRRVEPGCLFFAIKGERFDGNRFAGEALERGAAYAVVDDPDVVKDERYLLVEDTLETLQQLALHHRRRFSIPVIAIGGSNGKTTTKELVGAILSRRYRTHLTPGNFNNHIGLPLTLLAMPLDTEVAVLELGANHQGEIAALCRLSEPTHGLVTNIGKDHLEGFGGFAGVKKANAELYDYLAQTGGIAFINRDEPFLTTLAQKVERKVFYRQIEDAALTDDPYAVQLIAHTPRLQVQFRCLDSQLVRLDSHLMGRHNFQNVMTAIALGQYFKAPAEAIRSALAAYRPRNNRSQLLREGGRTILLDAYNANPTSMEAALRMLAEMDGDQKVAILGDMLELGPEADNEHRVIGALARELGISRIVLVGNHFAPVAEENHWEHFPSVAEARGWFREQNFDKATVLIKGSRSIGLERLLE